MVFVYGLGEVLFVLALVVWLVCLGIEKVRRAHRRRRRDAAMARRG